MCCETHAAHAHAMHDACCDHDGCCSSQDGFVRRFATRSERLAGLEAYRDELTKELAGVNERISELSNG